MSVKDRWLSKYHNEGAGFEEILTWDPFEHWDRSLTPEGRADNDFYLALKLTFAGEQSLREKFLQRSLRIIERIEAEDKLRSPSCRDRFPVNRGLLLRVKAHSLGLLQGQMQKGTLIESSEAYEEWCQSYQGGKWDSIPQAYYLNAVRLSWIAGDRGRARQLLKTWRRFKWHSAEYVLLRDLAEASELPIQASEIHDRFRTYFDRVRDPDYCPDVYMENHLVRVEFGILWVLYLETGEVHVDWERVVEVVVE